MFLTLTLVFVKGWFHLLTVLRSDRESEHSCLVPDITGNSSKFSPPNIPVFATVCIFYPVKDVSLISYSPILVSFLFIMSRG